MANRLKVLLIVDDWEALERYAEKLGPHFDILEAPFADEGVKAARKQLPDRIVLDLVFEDVSPDDALRMLAEDSATAGIPAIVVGGAVGEATASGHAQVRALKRPFDYPALIELLKR